MRIRDRFLRSCVDALGETRCGNKLVLEQIGHRQHRGARSKALADAFFSAKAYVMCSQLWKRELRPEANAGLGAKGGCGTRGLSRNAHQCVHQAGQATVRSLETAKGPVRCSLASPRTDPELLDFGPVPASSSFFFAASASLRTDRLRCAVDQVLSFPEAKPVISRTA